MIEVIFEENKNKAIAYDNKKLECLYDELFL